MSRFLIIALVLLSFSLGSNASTKSPLEELNSELNANLATGCTVDILSVDITNVSNCENRENGSICVSVTLNPEFELSINGGLSWTYGENEICLEDLSVGVYNIVIRDQGHCEVEYSGNPVTISVDNELTFDDIETTPETYYTLGTIIVIVTTGTSPYEYRIDGGTWQRSNYFTDLNEGTYTIDVKDFFGCEISDDATVNDERCPDFSTTSTKFTNCNSPNGTITFTTTTGIRPFTYSIDNGSTWQSDSVFENLSIASYQTAVKASNGCISYGNCNVNPNTVRFSSTSTVTDETCVGDNDGEIRCYIYAGTLPYTFSIDGGVTWISPGIFNDLAPDTYSVIVKDYYGCTDTDDFIVGSPSHTIITAIDQSNITDCYGNETGAISINNVLPSAPPTILKSLTAASSNNYSIDNGVTWQSDDTFEGLAAGEYYAISEEDGCEYEFASNPIIITEPDKLIFSSITSVPDDGSSSGEIEITATGGTGAITYSIDGGSTTQSTGTFTGLDAGIYSLVIDDDNACTNDSTFTLEEDTCPVFESLMLTTNTHCSAPNGTIRIEASSGVGDLSYSIDDGITWQSDTIFTGLSAGEYNIWVKDEEDCSTEWDSNPEILIERFISISGSSNNVTGCIGDATGAISSTCSGGSGTYDYSIDDGSSWQTEDGDFTLLLAGTYEVIGRDNYGCTDTIEFTINDPNHDTIDYVNTQNILACAGDLTGIISIDEALPPLLLPLGTSGGATSSQTYSIDNGVTWQTDQTFEDLAVGEYYAWIEDNGCEYEWASNPIIITEPDSLKFDLITITEDDGSSNGEIEITTTGGTGSIQYSANGGSTYQSSNIFSSLSVDDYNLTIVDENTCTNDSTVTVPSSDPIVTIPDAIFKTYLVGNTSVNTNSDTEIQRSEASTFNGTIDVTSLSVSDLTGIEEFTSLDILKCGGTDLTSLDVSNNTLLTYLNCYNIILTSLDLINNTALEHLNCSNSGITSLDVSNNIALTYLSCPNNNLPELNLSNNTLLSYISCPSNDLSTLSVVNCTNLRTFVCNNNQLTSLDVRNEHNSLISNFNADNNDLTCISVSDVTFATANWTDIDSGVSFSEDCDPVPEDEVITNTTFTSTDTICYGATLTITVGGDGNTVEFENESSITLIAGESISFMPGVVINSGSYVHAYITEDETFCDDLPESIVASDYNYKSIESRFEFTPEVNTELIKQDLKIYPNPNKGLFTVQINHFTKNTEIFIYNYLGSMVHHETMISEKTTVDLSNMKRGIYFVKAINGNQSNVKRLIIE